MNNNITVTVRNADEITADIQKSTSQLQTSLTKALEYVGSEMQENLQEHIYNDWYITWKPSKYKRRTDNPALGIPLGNEKNIKYDVKDARLTFEYTPSGEYAIKGWSERGGDELISAIQTGKLEGDPPPRPFWNNFVDEQINSGIVDALKTALGKEYKVVSVAGEIIPDGTERLN